MEVTGKFESASLTLEGGLRITFQITDKEQALKQIEKIEHMISLWKGCKEMNGY